MLVRWGYRFPRRYSIVYRLKRTQLTPVCLFFFWHSRNHRINDTPRKHTNSLLRVCSFSDVHGTTGSTPHQGTARAFSSQASEPEDSPEIQDDLNHPLQGKTMTLCDTPFASFDVFQTATDSRSTTGSCRFLDEHIRGYFGRTIRNTKRRLIWGFHFP